MMIAVAKKTLAWLHVPEKIYKYFILLLISLSAFLYIAIYTHVPISLQLYQTYDDALFIRLGKNIANGHWLGRFDKLTLAKGAGYPIFLAISSWSGAPVTFAQAIFYAAAALLLWSVTYKITRSTLFATLIFLLVLFNPNVFQERILRESIYTSQTLTLLCITWLALFESGKQSRLLIPVSAGLMLGWFWITREEGVWVLPGIAMLFAAKFMRDQSEGLRAFETFRRAASYVLACLSVLFIISLINFRHYKAFVNVDIKDPSFTAAMQQLQRVHVGEGIPYVPLSKESRERLYELSPDFAILKPTLDPQEGANPSVGSECWIWRSACHDFSAGQLLWQIRNGAAAAGKYSGEKEARTYFRHLARQVSHICEEKLVPCYGASPIAMMPHLYEVQLRSVWPSIVSAWSLLLQKDPRGWVDAPPSDGSQNDLEGARHFLNYPLSTDVASSRTSASRMVAMSGWFIDDANGWFALDTPSGAQASVNRLPSPDIARLFPKAVSQRFQINLACGDACDVEFVSQTGDVFNFDPGAPPKLHSDIHYGRSVIAFDSVTIQSLEPAPASAVVVTSRKSRQILRRLYSVVVTPLVYAGIFCFLMMLVFYSRRMLSSDAFIFSAAVAVLVISRTAILLLINISSFPSLTPAYFSPALCLLPVCSMFAIWSLVGSVARSPLNRRGAKR